MVVGDLDLVAYTPKDRIYNKSGRLVQMRVLPTLKYYTKKGWKVYLTIRHTNPIPRVLLPHTGPKDKGTNGVASMIYWEYDLHEFLCEA
jgi:hypothetical protein